MKNLYTHTSSTNRFLYKENVDVHTRISKGARKVTDLPFEAANYVSDKVHNVLESATSRVPVVGKPLSYIPTLTKKATKGILNTAKNVVGGVVGGASHLTTRTVGTVGKTVTEVGKGLGNAGKSAILHKSTLSEREARDLSHGKDVRKKRTEKAKAKKAAKKQ